MARVVVDNVSKRYGGLQVLHNLNVEIEDGKFVVLVGPSGCGKSTLLRMIAGLESISDGEMSIDGRVVNDLAPRERDIAMVFQNYALYPHMTVAENMSFALRLMRSDKGEISKRIDHASGILALGPYLARKPAALSGGQRQRVAMGRAIVRDPKVFLFDEPLSNLDAKLRVQMRSEIRGLHDRLKTTTIYVTHDQTEAMTMADQIVVLNQGRIEQIGTPLELYRSPANLFVAGFIGSPAMNLITGRHAETAGATTLGIRPEHIQLASDNNGITGQVVFAEHLGSDTFLSVDVADAGRLIVRGGGDLMVSAGDQVSLVFPAERLHRFDGSGNAIR
ncbi:MAG: sn-glycerol-3-phosphate ABC transporter ATP-binding protein UgpC [Rhizobiaceae bacterium]|nr:sn-glycerol-3-phosphate ABC transporter ATP-binding protein UgpC [Rhizobiaceae bacterium]